MIGKEMATEDLGDGRTFSMADRAESPALFYANKVMPFGKGDRNVASTLDRLKARPSLCACDGEAEPYFGMFPEEA